MSEEAQIEMPKYRSHKEVRGLKIAAVEIHRDKSATIYPSDVRYQPFRTREGWANRFGDDSEDPGYYVVYEDGFTSWSPTKSFENGYTRIDTPRKHESGEVFSTYGALMLSKGTIVKLDGIPCELQHDTEIESEHFRAKIRTG